MSIIRAKKRRVASLGALDANDRNVELLLAYGATLDEACATLGMSVGAVLRRRDMRLMTANRSMMGKLEVLNADIMFDSDGKDESDLIVEVKVGGDGIITQESSFSDLIAECQNEEKTKQPACVGVK